MNTFVLIRVHVLSDFRPEFVEEVWPLTNAIFAALNAENERKVEALLSSTPSSDVLNIKHSETVTMQNILCLRGSNWLNDAVINFYMAMLEDWSKQFDNSRTIAYNTFFMSKLLKDIEEVRKWRSRRRTFVDVWSVQQLLIPINISNKHWTLMAVRPQELTMTYLDSLEGNGTVYFSAIVNFFNMRAVNAEQRSAQWKLSQRDKSPRQPNPNDCGVYTLMNASLLTHGRTIHASTYADAEAVLFRKKIICMGHINFL
jgi:sentrin-specific protease 2 (axin associating molecule)